MKILLDTCISGGVVEALRSAGHDVVWSRDWPQDPGDEEILHRAYRDGRVLITLDKDFGELAIVYGKSHCGIVRLVGLSTIQQTNINVQIINKYGDGLQKGAIVTAESNRLRFRPPTD